MNWSVQKAKPAIFETDLLVLPCWQEKETAVLAPYEPLAPAVLSGLRAGVGKVFCGEAASCQLLPSRETAAPWLLLVGLGPREKMSSDGIRRAAGVAAGQARKIGIKSCATILPELGGEPSDPQTVTRCWIEGAELALSPQGALKSQDAKQVTKSKGPQDWSVITTDGRQLRRMRRGAVEGEAFAAGCLLSRRLVDLPGNYLTPELLAKEARQMARQHQYRCRVLGPDQLKKAGMGGLLGVAQGSHQEPRLIVLESKPLAKPSRRRRRKIALVGKGVTFDSGGISIKPAAKMDLMKTDMSGAAAVLGAALVIARLQLPVDVVVIIPATENLPGSRAYKPGDVLTMASGHRVEVLNTDAEGRLILADALHHAGSFEPDWIIDAATLTGACVYALGRHFAGLMSNSSELVEVLTQAGGETFERVWQLPLIAEHHESLKSDVADLKNIGPGEGGALTAGAFLEAFVVEGVPWAHLDIAGTAWTEKAGPLGPKGATGYGARLLARAVQILVS